jgi:hypothetical protein
VNETTTTTCLLISAGWSMHGEAMVDEEWVENTRMLTSSCDECLVNEETFWSDLVAIRRREYNLNNGRHEAWLEARGEVWHKLPS